MTPTRLFAFLRAVNVGGRVVRMAELRKLVEGLGFGHVETFIASGNLTFSAGRKSPAIVESMIETALGSALGYPVPTMVRTAEELGAIAGYRAFSPGMVGAGSLHVGLLKSPLPDTARRNVLALQTDIDRLAVHGREIYWLARQNLAGSSIPAGAMAKAVRAPVTFRNINTMIRLAAKYAIKMERGPSR